MIGKSIAFAAVVALVAGMIPVRAQLPGEASIAGVDKKNVREGYRQVLLHDYDSREVFNPYFVESVTAAAGDDSLRTAVSGDSSVLSILDTFAEGGVEIYVMEKLQGRALRVLVNAGVPVLCVGTDRNIQRGITRVFGDVIYAYREPDYLQGSRKDPADVVYTFKTVRGFRLEAKEQFAPDTKEVSILSMKAQLASDRLDRLELEVQNSYEMCTESPLKKMPFNVFSHYCVVTSPQRKLSDIKKLINDGLSDVGFEYKLPEFKRLTASMLE